MRSLFLLILLNTIILGKTYADEDGTDRIILGEEIPIEKVPWTVSLHNSFAFEKDSDFFCGGVIIGPKEVLTAAHCVSRPKTIYVRAGTPERQKGGTVHNVVRVEIPKTFVYGNCEIKQDVAFLVVKEPFVFNDKVKAIKIADRDPANGDEVLVAGWGRKSPIDGDPAIWPFKLQHVNLTTWHKYHCFDRFGVPDILETDYDMICMSNAPNSFEATCAGDSGSPVVQDNELVGISSADISDQFDLPPDRECGPYLAEEQDALSCNHPKTVPIYNSVVAHKQWILDLLKESSSSDIVNG